MKWIPAGRQEKGERCFPQLVMFRRCYSEMPFPPCTQRRTIGTSLEHPHALPLQLQPQYPPLTQTLVKLLPCCQPLPGQRLWENKAPSIARDSFTSQQTLMPHGAVQRSPFLHDVSAPAASHLQRAWTARVSSNHQAPRVGKFGASACALWIVFEILLGFDQSF